MHRCRHDIAYQVLKLCEKEPTYASEMFQRLHMKYPTIRSAVHYLTYRYAIVPVNTDGTLPWEEGETGPEGKQFLFPTKQYPYYITRMGKMMLKRLEGWYEMDRLATKFTIEDMIYFTTTKDKADSIFLKPNRFVKAKARTAPKWRGFKSEEVRNRAENAFVGEDNEHEGNATSSDSDDQRKSNA